MVKLVDTLVSGTSGSDAVQVRVLSRAQKPYSFLGRVFVFLHYLCINQIARLMKIDIQNGDCRECYRCLRSCAVKAINIKGAQAVVDTDTCVGCGDCLESCPQGLIGVESTVGVVQRLMDDDVRIVASVHWSWFLGFGEMGELRFSAALRELGFEHVSEALWGLKLYNQTLRTLLPTHLHELRLIAPCPVAQRMVEVHHPELQGALVDIANPMVLHGRLVRKLWGNDVRVVHLAPCRGFVDAVDESDFVVTFGELQRWMQSAQAITTDFVGEASVVGGFEPAACPLPGELGAVGSVLRVHGVQRIDEVLDEANLTQGVALKLMACGDCTLGSTGGSNFVGTLSNYLLSKEHYKAKRYLDDYDMPRIETATHSLGAGRNVADTLISKSGAKSVSADQISEALHLLLKFDAYDYHNCNACGYGTCARFARALAQGKVDKDVCLSYTRKQLYEKFRNLIEVIPSGVMLVDSSLRVLRANGAMIALLGAGAKMVDSVDPGMAGADVRKLVDFSDLMEGVLETGRSVKEREVECQGRLLSVSVFGIDGGRGLCVVASPLLESDFFDNNLITHTEQVMAENLRSVEQIAALLGQNAARMESVLRSIIVRKSTKETK